MQRETRGGRWYAGQRHDGTGQKSLPPQPTPLLDLLRWFSRVGATKTHSLSGFEGSSVGSGGAGNGSDIVGTRGNHGCGNSDDDSWRLREDGR